MKLDLEIDDEVLDGIVKQYLLRTIENAYEDKEALMNKKELLEQYEKEDLSYSCAILFSLKEVYKHITSRDEWHKLDRYDS